MWTVLHPCLQLCRLPCPLSLTCSQLPSKQEGSEERGGGDRAWLSISQGANRKQPPLPPPPPRPVCLTLLWTPTQFSVLSNADLVLRGCQVMRQRGRETESWGPHKKERTTKTEGVGAGSQPVFSVQMKPSLSSSVLYLCEVGGPDCSHSSWTSRSAAADNFCCGFLSFCIISVPTVRSFSSLGNPQGRPAALPCTPCVYSPASTLLWLVPIDFLSSLS